MSEEPPHLIVDAMNVIGTRPNGWWRDRDGAARRLVADLQRLAATEGAPLTVVLDGRPLPDLPEGTHDGVLVLHGRGGRDGADDRIVSWLEALPEGDRDEYTVVTADRRLIDRVRALGGHATGPRALLARLDELPP